MSRASATWVFNKKWPHAYGKRQRAIAAARIIARYSGASRSRRIGVCTTHAIAPEREMSSDEMIGVHEATEVAAQATSLPTEGLASFRRDFETAIGGDGIKRLVAIGKAWPNQLGDRELVDAKRVPGCAARVWVDARLDGNDGTLQFHGQSDSAITRGLCAVLCVGLSGLTPERFLEVTRDGGFIRDLGLDPVLVGSSHRHGLFSIFERMKKQVYSLLGKQDTVFPSLLISREGFEAKGAYAQAQAKYLEPDAGVVERFVAKSRANAVGIVAHFYMDPEVQGVLAAAKREWEHIHISDSLVMADRAVAMAEAGCKSICVLGVDFMSENVRATLDHAGFHDVGVYRMATEAIGCTLAEAAHSDLYGDYLRESAGLSESLHVVYINTSLKTKAQAHGLLPTITCTSSNVLQTVLQAAAQVPNVAICYGPDAYMGANLEELLTQLSERSDEEIKQVHPAHTRASVKRVVSNFRYFGHGICAVHDMFGADVARTIEQGYCDAFLTAHFEVPGEMFQAALKASRLGDRGVIGSTKNILDFITKKVDEALAAMHADTEEEDQGTEGEQPAGSDAGASAIGAVKPKPQIPDATLRFVLGTESGMVTSIVNSVKAKLAAIPNDVTVEIIFPVCSDAVVTADQTSFAAGGGAIPDGLAILPGAASGEGCSVEGGCASCPYMKMNSLDALMDVLGAIEMRDISHNIPHEKSHERGEGVEGRLRGLAPKMADPQSGASHAALGSVPILHMRHLQQHGVLSDALVKDIQTR